MAENRKLSPQSRVKVEKQLSLGCDLKLMSEELSKNGKKVLKKDLSNIKSTLTTQGDNASLEDIEKLLREKYSNYVCIIFVLSLKG